MRRRVRTVRTVLAVWAVLAGVLVAGLGVVGFTTPVVGNVWLSATDSDYRIPPQSSVFTFRATRMNPGSGGWWLYGEDDERYYASDGDPGRVVAIDKADAARCVGFDPLEASGWCDT